jgi:murein DD-endopeptidase MepM/ murein hydrolase activator NlpD
MASRRFTIVVSDASTGAERRVSLGRRTAWALLFCVLVLPLAWGVAARWSAQYELATLAAANAALRLENDSYRAATGQLTAQVGALQGAVANLTARSALDPGAAAAMAKLPPAIQNRALGGQALPPVAARAVVSTAVTSPENTFGVLRDLLGVIETRLRAMSGDLERRNLLARATPSIWPAVGWLTDGFGSRSDPFTGEAARHQGLDIAGQAGQPVYATADGVVRSAERSGEFGNLIVIDHEFGLVTRYAHLSRFAVQPGQRVARGEVVGQMGSTGRSTGPHLHYEVWANDRPLNPLKLLTAPAQR